MIVRAIVSFLAVTMIPVSGVLADAATDDMRERGRITVCADPYTYPASAQGRDPGYDIEIMRAVANLADLEMFFEWVNTGTRGGLGKALRNSIVKGRCDVFVGIGVTDEQVDELAEKDLIFTTPYMSQSYVLLVQGSAENAKTLDDLRDTKVGVPMSTPIDAYMFDNDRPRELYNQDRRVLKGFMDGEIDAALVWAPALGKVRSQMKDIAFSVVEGYIPVPEFRWNMAMAIPNSDANLKTFMDEGIRSVIADGQAKEIVESYGVPYLEPIE